MNGSSAYIILIFPLCFLDGVSAEEILHDSMDYADAAAMRAAWLPGAGTAPDIGGKTNLVPMALSQYQKRPADGPFLALGNGVCYRELGVTLTSDWILEANLLSTSYTRSHGIFLLNATGTEGYGVLWSTTNVNQNSGRGVVWIRKFSNNTYTNWSTFGTGTQLGSAAGSNHPVTGYTVTSAPDGNQNNATFDTSAWQDFLKLKLTWDRETAKLTLFWDGIKVSQVTDGSFSSFSRIYLRGNTTGYFDNITVKAVPNPADDPP